MLRTVYRIEDAEGRGPFSQDVIYRALDAAYGADHPNTRRYDPGKMPVPYNDSGPVRDKHMALESDTRARGAWFYAFPNMNTLRHWFKPAVLAQLAKRGYQVNVYRIDDDSLCAASDDQVLFHRPASTFLRRHA